MNNKVFLISSALIIFAVCVSFMSYVPARADAGLKVRVSDFPASIGDWVSTDVPISETVYRILETRNLFIRDYKNAGGESVYLYIVYSEDNRKVSHPPEVCLMGGGLTIIEKTPVPITNSIRATKLLVEKADSREVVVYWYKAGPLYTDSYLKQQLKIVTDRVFGRRTPGALVRLSTAVKGNDQEAALKLLEAFSVRIEPLLAKYVP